ncbi:MinD-like ATPase involved in chromosome partitioning or flagellar assembly [Rhodococcus sp. OK302]|nr:MinD-like ATPase involved in chromosome partitioning or flagellar assembly [Rhodococcus sp. OK302]
MADSKDDAGAGIWEPVRPAASPHEQSAVTPVAAPVPVARVDQVRGIDPAVGIDAGTRSLFVAPTDSTDPRQVPRTTSPDSGPMYAPPQNPRPAATQAPVATAASSVPAAAPIVEPSGPRQPVIQYPAGPPGFTAAQFSTTQPPQTYEPAHRGAPPAAVANPAPVNPVAANSVVPQPDSGGTPRRLVVAPSMSAPSTLTGTQPSVSTPSGPQISAPQISAPGAPGQQVAGGLQAAPSRPESQQPASALPMSAQDLSSALLLKQVKAPPVGGWRKALYAMSGRHLNLGNGTKDQRMLELTRQINQPLQGCYKVAVLSLKGGVGKTTTTVTLGSTFASVRGDRVIALDANPDRGTLSQKVPLETPATVRNLLRDEATIEKYSDVRGYTSQSRHRLEVLASDSDPAVSEAFSGEDYMRTVDMLEKFYSIVLTDCGTGLMHSAMKAILDGSNSLIVISSGSVDGARSASATLDWLDAHGHSRLVANSVAVINAVRPGSGKVDLSRVIEHFEQRCRSVQLVPFDPHLEEGAEVDLDRLRPSTRDALFELAAAVAQDFPRSPNGFPQQR